MNQIAFLDLRTAYFSFVPPALVLAAFLSSGCGSSSGGNGNGNAPPDLVTSGACLGVRLPQDQHFAAAGLCVRAVANKQGELRQIMFTPDGDLIGVRVSGSIVRYRDLNGDGVFGKITDDGADAPGEVVEIANTGNANGNNATLDGDFLYAGSVNGVKRWPYSPSADSLGEGDDVVVGQPSDGSHTFHTVHVYDGFLYVHSGSMSNAAFPASPDYDTHRAVLKRFDLSMFTSGTPFSWDEGEVVITGIRNMVGFTRAADGKMYGVVNGLDDVARDGADVHADNPGDELIAIQPGDAHGYPYCFSAAHILNGSDVVKPGTMLATAIRQDSGVDGADFVNPHDDAWCADNAVPAVTLMTAHSAPLDITFSDASATALPNGLQGGALVAVHGSWDTQPSVGHRVIFIPIDSEGNAPQPRADANGATFPFTTVFGGGSSAGEIDGIWGWSSGSWGENPVRPVSVAISPTDGALYVSSDNGNIAKTTESKQGMLYRIQVGAD
jgi:glucose/arabinose dehydrogenase